MMTRTEVLTYLERCRLKPYEHQVVGVERTVNNLFFFNTDEMGAGKSKQCIDATQILFEQNLIGRVIIVAPASVRGVWFDQELGELRKHLWNDTHHKIIEWHARHRAWMFETNGWWDGVRHLTWIISNYEFIRNGARLQELLEFCGPKTLLILDESSAVKNYKAEQTKACMQLRQHCGRVILLNGTPIANSPADLFSQGQLLSKKILDCKTYFHFRSKYAVMGGFNQRQIVAWRNLEDIQRRFAPYTIRRLKQDCLDLPEKLEPVILTVPLDHKTWSFYREMRDEMVAWLTHTTVSVAPQAVVKALRLAQITSGFIGGVEEAEPQEQSLEFEPDTIDLDLARPSFIPRIHAKSDSDNIDPSISPSKVTLGDVCYNQEIGREKLDAFLEWFELRLHEDPAIKLLVWCRFRPELWRAHLALQELSLKLLERKIILHTGVIWGGQSRDRFKMIEGKRTLIKEGERDRAIRLLDPRTTVQKDPVVVVGTPATGAMGLNLTAAHVVIYLSNDFSLKTRLQSEDRVHRPGQTHHVSYTDVVATGPAGQKTIDHHVLKALRNKEDIANWTTGAWVHALTEE